jgi:hypothetical protein
MKVRLILTVEESMKEYIKDQASKLGITINGFVNIAISQYKDQRDMIADLPQMLTAFAKLQEEEDQKNAKAKTVKKSKK